jgi:3-oxoisoapionate decarboxylase
VLNNVDSAKLGIGSWSVPWAIGVQGYPKPQRPLSGIDLLEMAVEAKVEVVQIADNLPLHELPDMELDGLREAANTRGRTVLSGSLCGPKQMTAAEAGLKQILPALERQEVTLALENNEAFAAVEFAGLIRRIASPYVGICLDTANSLGRPETLETLVEHLAEYTVVLHTKDYDIRRIDTRMGFSVVGTPVGDGRVDFDWVLAELRRRARGGISVIVEHWPPFAGNIEETVRLEEEWLARSVRFLRSKL